MAEGKTITLDDSLVVQEVEKKIHNTVRVKYRVKRTKKRRFYANKYTKLASNLNQSSTTTSTPTTTVTQTPTLPLLSETPTPSTPSVEPITDTPLNTNTVSFSKVQLFNPNTPKENQQITGYRFIDAELLSFVFSQVKCPACSESTLRLVEKFSEKKGYASSLSIKCSSDCEYHHSFYTSRKCTDSKTFDVNNRIVYAMRNSGQGHSSLEQFSALMDMPKPMTKKNFQILNNKITRAVETIAEQTMLDASTELLVNKDSADVGVSVDGAWQRRGYASFNGLVAAISIDSGKVLDVEAMSRHCKACREKEPLITADKEQYDTWYELHKTDCLLNCTGSAGSMEVTGAMRIFKGSLAERRLRYSKYLGDGDSKSHLSIKNVYDGIEVEKLECVGHVQKRVGTRLCKLKKNKKGLGGKGKLTDSIIDRLQNYYGIAIRNNKGNLDEMKKAIHATLFHVASSKTQQWHDHCPDGVSSWCQFKQDKATGRTSYKPGAGLSLEIIQHVKPIFQ